MGWYYVRNSWCARSMGSGKGDATFAFSRHSTSEEGEPSLLNIKSRWFLRQPQTLEILHRIDANIVESFYSQSSQSFSSVLSLKDKNELIGRMLDVLEIQCSEDGELYARRVVDLLRAADTSTEKSGPVLEKAVEMILLYIQNCKYIFSFCVHIVTNLHNS